MLFTDRNIYKKNFKKLIGKNDCPFYELKNERLLYQTKYWNILYNKYPYYGEKQNLLVVTKKHKKFTTELSFEEFKDLKNIEIFMKNFFKAKNYFSFIRQTKGARSAEHLHYHYLEGKFCNIENTDFKVLI